MVIWFTVLSPTITDCHCHWLTASLPLSLSLAGTGTITGRHRHCHWQALPLWHCTSVLLCTVILHILQNTTLFGLNASLAHNVGAGITMSAGTQCCHLLRHCLPLPHLLRHHCGVLHYLTLAAWEYSIWFFCIMCCHVLSHSLIGS